METEKLESKIENPEAQPNLGKLDQLAAQANESGTGAGFMEPGTKTKEKGKRGRPSKEESAKKAAEQKKAAQGPQDPQNPQQTAQGPAQPLPPSAESLMAGKMLTKSISGLGVAIAEDPRASMTPDELEAGAEILARLMDKYMPQIMGQYGLEAGALMVFGQYGLRVMAVKKAKKLEAIKREKDFMEKMKNPPPPPGPQVPTNDGFEKPVPPELNVDLI